MKPLAGVIAAGVLALAGCRGDADSGGELNREDYGDDWPFTVESGILRCEPPGAVLFESDGGTYAVNGLAMGDNFDAAAIDPIWQDDPDLEGTKINIGPIIDAGLDLCED